MSATPSTRITRLREKQDTSRERLDELLDCTPLATIALVRDGHPVVFPTGFARIGDELVIHGSTGSPWLRALAAGGSAAVSVTALDGVMVARSGFESSFRYRSAAIFGVFEVIDDDEKSGYLDALVDSFIPGRVAELRASTGKELAATQAMRLPIGEDNWSLKIGAGWPEDPEADIASGAWAGVVPMTVSYGAPLPAPDVIPGTPTPVSVRALSTTNLGNMRMSAKAEYAVRAMVQLATVDDGVVKTDDLAKAQGIPPQFLVDILAELRTDRLVRSHRGRDGGYELARPANTISIADVLRCIDGPLASVRDIGLGDLPYSGPTAALTDVWRALRASMRSVLEQTSLADVASGALPSHVVQLAGDYRGQEEQRGHSVD